MRVRIQGTWPATVTLQRGWHRAVARPWNDDLPFAHLRMERGSTTFLADCAETLLAAPGVTGVLSPPLLPGARAPWAAAGFSPHRLLLLLRRNLDALGDPSHPVTLGSPTDLPDAQTIDRAAFEPIWRLGEIGLRDALTATRRSALFLVRPPAGAPVGFAIIGAGVSLAYLQRLAVVPAAQSAGIGRSLLRAGSRWARRRGAEAILVNTPAENDGAASFYQSEGFRIVTRDLAVLGRFA